jgi:HlyD family secretion protein
VKNGADQHQLRAAQANVVSAASKRDAARAQLDLLLEGPTEEQIAAAEGRVAQAQASVKQAELAVEQTVLEAPFDATVAAIYVTAGEQASPGLPTVTLVDATSLHVNVAVDELDVGRLARDQTVRLTFDALPDAILTGTVQQIAAAAAGADGGVVTYDVRIDLAPMDVPIRADMTTNATIVVEELSDVLQIPTWAVRVDRETGQYYVNRRSGDSIERADVSLGARSEGVAQVLDGLSAGDEIVRAPESSPFDFGTD